MRVTRHKTNQIGELSPVTKKGEVIMSRIELIDDPNEPHNPWQVTYTPDAEEAMKVLHFLDEMNGIGWTPDLRRIERELRLAMIDIMTAYKKEPTDELQS